MKTQPELRHIDTHRNALFEEGILIGKMAHSLYPGGRHIDQEASAFPHRLALTEALLKDPACPTLFEATFQYQNTLIMVDILHKTPEGMELIEVKSSTSEKAIFIDDLSLQYYVLTGLTIPIKNVFLMHINAHYVRKAQLKLSKLFKKSALTDKVSQNQNKVHTQINAMRNSLQNAQEPLFFQNSLENIDIGTHCFHPYNCDFMPHCWKHIPPHSVFNLTGLPIESKFELYKKGHTLIQDIPDSHLLSESSQVQKKAESESPLINKPAIQDFLKTLHYPLYFMDFEAFQKAIPPYPGVRPYQQIPFQFSIHYLNSPFDTLSHKEFLADPKKDPRYEFARALVKHIPQTACVLTYDSGYEKSVVKQLAETFPKLSTHLMAIHANIIDLMIPFQKHYYYTQEMKGSCSIKAILPALVPELTYTNLHIPNGEMASKSYSRLAHLKDPKEIQTIRQDLLDYCRLDTFAMVKIVEVLIKESQ